MLLRSMDRAAYGVDGGPVRAFVALLTPCQQWA